MDAAIAVQSADHSIRDRRFLRRATFVIFILGALLRAGGVERPLDDRLVNAWRESDYTQVARNFYREGMNPFYPRIDWRGDTPGYVEMEFPLLPWLAAGCDRLFGYNEEYLRAISALFSIAGLWLFCRLAFDLLPAAGALFATAAFALNPLLVKMGNSMQPEPVMMFFSLLFVVLIERWRREATARRLVVAASVLAAATLSKSPAAVLGLVLLVRLLQREGRLALTRPINYLAAMTAILPPLAWMAWSRHFWVDYGNSLGVSNESHWLTWRVLTPPVFLLGNLRWELLLVWTPIGLGLALAAIRAERRHTTPAWLWYGAVCVFYFAAGGTSGDAWASYYHCLSVPPVCLLMGAGFDALLRRPGGSAADSSTVRRRRTPGMAFGAGVLLMLTATTAVALYRRDHQNVLREMRACALELSALVPADGKIVVRGGMKRDEYGGDVAYNEPMMFAWMDRKGFNYAREDLSIATLTELKNRGAAYWVVRNSVLERNAELGRYSREQYRRVGVCSCGTFSVYELNSPSPMPPMPDFRKGGVR